ncbi:MAG: AraC family transcriptional regulator [Chitinophagaceae bacterium]
MIYITLSNNETISFKPGEAKKYKGTRIPGAEMFQAESHDFIITVHEFSNRLFRYSLRNIQAFKDQVFTIRDDSQYLRLETLVTGEMNVNEPGGAELKILAGQARIVNAQLYQLRFDAYKECLQFTIYLSPELLAQTPMRHIVQPGQPKMMSPTTKQKVDQLFINSFEEWFREGYYDSSTRDFLFNHLATPNFIPPGQLKPKHLAAVYAADHIIASDLSKHYTIEDLAKLTNTNVDVIKTGFLLVFQMGPFERRLKLKMDYATFLLSTTDKQIQEIAFLTGYESDSAFINEFRKQFDVSPRMWRKQNRGLI